MIKSNDFSAGIKQVEHWLDLAEELQPILSQKAKDLENAIFAKDFKQIEQVALDFSDLNQIYYNSVGYNAWSNLLKAIDKISGENADDPMRLAAALSSISNWSIESGNLWAIVSEANKQDEIEIDDVVADSKVILKSLKKDIANIPKMIDWLEKFLLEAAKTW